MKTLYFKNGILVRSSWSDSDFLDLLACHSPEWLIQQLNDDNTIRNSANGEMIEALHN
jgi:hypothetical protein